MTRRAGFTLIELLIVMIVIGVLAALGVLRYIDVRNHAVASGIVSELNVIRLAAYNHWADNETFPPDAPAGVNPQGVRVTAFRKPTEEELAHDFLWRVHHAVPPRGVIGLFNRSHYEDVLVVRVNGLAPRAVWDDRYQRINEFEAHLAASGVVVVKFFLHISREEQRVRLIERLEDPRKNWKFNEGDLKERAQWDAYTEAYEAALSRCSTAEAPWYVVPANRNAVRNVLVARTVLRTLERIAPVFPPATREALELRATIV